MKRNLLHATSEPLLTAILHKSVMSSACVLADPAQDDYITEDILATIEPMSAPSDGNWGAAHAETLHVLR